MSHAPVPPDPDRLAAAVAAFRQMPAPDRPADDVVLARLAAGGVPAADPFTRSRRKLLMRVATWSLAASVLAVAGGLLLFGGSPGVALADVVKAAERHKLVKYKWTTTTEVVSPPELQHVSPAHAVEMIRYADLQAPRFRDEVPATVLADVVRFSRYTVLDGPKNRFLNVVSNEPTVNPDDPKLDDATRQFVRQMQAERKQAVLSTIPATQGGTNQTTLLDQLRDLQRHKDARAEVEGFLVKYTVVGKTPLDLADGAGGNVRRQVATTTTLWVDKDTKLPVRMTVEMLDPEQPVRLDPQNPKVQNRWFTESSEFEWDPKLPAGMKSADDLFSLTPPEGYKFDDQTKKPAPAKP